MSQLTDQIHAEYSKVANWVQQRYGAETSAYVKGKLDEARVEADRVAGSVESDEAKVVEDVKVDETKAVEDVKADVADPKPPTA